jgi:16S rRNA (uracil1498-N3)-methyltransferase
MRLHRLHIDNEITTGASISLPAERVNYLVKVLRLKPGSELLVFNGQGGEYQATLIEAGKRSAVIKIGTFIDREAESPLDIVLLQAISKGERMDYTIQKAVELGVHRIVPVFSQRSVVQLKGERLTRKQSHWQQIAVSACEQCGRNRVPAIEIPQTLTQVLEFHNRDSPGLILDPESGRGIEQLPDQGTSISLLIGPEGGLSAEEVDLARRSGFTGIRLGPRILRTETAAVTAISILQVRWGDLCN